MVLGRAGLEIYGALCEKWTQEHSLFTYKRLNLGVIDEEFDEELNSIEGDYILAGLRDTIVQKIDTWNQLMCIAYIYISIVNIH